MSYVVLGLGWHLFALGFSGFVGQFVWEIRGPREHLGSVAAACMYFSLWMLGG